jgi:AraC-like DNA-binding protein
MLIGDNHSCSTPPVEVSGHSHQFAQVLINRMRTFECSNGFESYGELSPEIGFGTVRKLDLREDISVEIFDQYFHEDPSSKFNLTYKSLRFVFFMHGVGHLKVSSPFGKTKTTVDQPIQGCCSLGHFPELEGGFRIKKQSRYVQVTVNIAPSIITAILQDQFDGLPQDIHNISEGADNVGYYHIAPISKPIYSTLYELLFCPYSGAARKMYIESKALELVAHKLAQTQSSPGAPVAVRLSGNKDFDKIYEAEYLLIRDIEHPPLLHELAHCVGMSPKKLNAGFRKTFGTTVFGHLQRIRLERARYLMEKHEKNVTEAALAVGYNSVPSFSQAFSSHFLIPPKQCTKP